MATPRLSKNHYLLILIGMAVTCVAISPAASQDEKIPAEQMIRCTPIRALISSGAPKDYVWVHASVIKADEEDTLTIEDSSGKILLFLPTDELIAQYPAVGSDLFVLGKVDISPIHPSKNELYAERIVIAATQQ